MWNVLGTWNSDNSIVIRHCHLPKCPTKSPMTSVSSSPLLLVLMCGSRRVVGAVASGEGPLLAVIVPLFALAFVTVAVVFVVVLAGGASLVAVLLISLELEFLRFAVICLCDLCSGCCWYCCGDVCACNVTVVIAGVNLQSLAVCVSVGDGFLWFCWLPNGVAAIRMRTNYKDEIVI